MTLTQLPTLTGPEVKPKSGNKPKQLVVFLHGLGADGNDLIGLAPHFAGVLPDAHFLSPDAPFPCDMAPYGRQWFSLLQRSEGKVLEGLKIAAPVLNHFLDQQLKRFDLKERNLALIGFSQGSMLSLYVALRRNAPVAGVLAYSGALVGASLLPSEQRSSPSVCLVHGEEDTIVPFDAFQHALTVLQRQHVPVQGYSRKNLGHGIDPAGMQIGREFLTQVFVGK